MSSSVMDSTPTSFLLNFTVPLIAIQPFTSRDLCINENFIQKNVDRVQEKKNVRVSVFCC